MSIYEMMFELELCNDYVEIAYIPIHILLEKISLGKRRANAKAKSSAILTHLTYAVNATKESASRKPEDFLPYVVQTVNPLLEDFSPEELSEIDYLIDKRVISGVQRIEWMQLVGRL
jgi:hypothetical protein